MAMAVEPRITWQTVTIDQVAGMPLWQLKELSEARKRDRKIAAEQAAAAEKVASEPQPAESTLTNGKAAPNSSQQPKAPDATQTGPARSTRRSARTAPYSRAAGSQKNSNGENQPKTNGAPAHPTANGASPAKSPEPAAGAANRDEASEESIKETVVMIARLQKELEDLEEENRVVLQTATNARVVAARLKEKLAFEREKTDKVVAFLKNWQKTHPGWKFDDVFPKEGATATQKTNEDATASAVDIDPEDLARLERDFEGMEKGDFEQLKRRFATINNARKEASASNEGSDAANDDVDGKGKGKAQDKGKGKECAVDVDETQLPTNSSKDKGKAKETAPGSPPNSKKRAWSQFQAEVALYSFMKHQEAAQVAEAKRRSRLDMSSTNPQASGSGSRLPEASGNGTRLPEANRDATKLPEEAVAADEEPQCKRRKVHWDGTSPDSDTAPQTFEEKALSFMQHFLGRSLWPGIPSSTHSARLNAEHLQRRYLSLIMPEIFFDDDSKEPEFKWNSDGTPNIKLPEPDAPNYVSEIQRACRFLWTPPPKEVVAAKDIFKLNNEAIPVPERGPYFDWDGDEGIPIIQLPDADHPSFLPILLRVGQELGDYDPSLPPSRRRLRAKGNSSLYCSWDFARRPVVILPPPEDPNYVEAVQEAAKFILRGPGPENVWHPSMTGFFKVRGKARRGKVPHVEVKRNSEGGLSVQLPNHTAQDYNESILLANEWIEEILNEDQEEEESAN